jgi:hypothetical protein
MRFLLTILLALVLVGLTTAGSCESQGGQYREMGEKLGTMSQEGSVPGSYAYVADMVQKLYWPNQDKYINAIPSENRVYIKDAAALAEFKEYKPGPL